MNIRADNDEYMQALKDRLTQGMVAGTQVISPHQPIKLVRMVAAAMDKVITKPIRYQFFDWLWGLQHTGEFLPWQQLAVLQWSDIRMAPAGMRQKGMLNILVSQRWLIDLDYIAAIFNRKENDEKEGGQSETQEGTQVCAGRKV